MMWLSREAMEGREGRTFQYGLAREKREVVGECRFSVVESNDTVTWLLGGLPVGFHL